MYKNVLSFRLLFLPNSPTKFKTEKNIYPSHFYFLIIYLFNKSGDNVFVPHSGQEFANHDLQLFTLFYLIVSFWKYDFVINMKEI